jgi:polar amino acid transport system substrate-binding protein
MINTKGQSIEMILKNLFISLIKITVLVCGCFLIGTVHAQELSQDKTAQKLHVVTKEFNPFVFKHQDNYIGFSIDLWEAIAKEIGLEYEIYGVETITELLDNVRQNQADVGIAGISMTLEREKVLDFSYPFFKSGLQIMVRYQSEYSFAQVLSEAVTVIFSPKILYAIGILLITLIVMAHIIWFIERKHNSEFAPEYWKGVWDGLWWSAVTVTTVGYGDKISRGVLGRLFALFWMFIGLFIIASFTATVTTTLTVQKLQNTIEGPKELFGKTVATVQGSTADQYLSGEPIQVVRFNHIEQAYQALEQHKVDAVVYDAPALWYYAAQQGKGKVKTVGPVFKRESYSIALPSESAYLEEINQALLKLGENGQYEKIVQKWFGYFSAQ